MTYDPAHYSQIHHISHPHGFLDWRLGTGGIAEIVELEVQPDFRRHHIGEWLIQQLLIAADQHGAAVIYAFTRQENRVAQQFYVHQRFRLTPLPGFYVDGDTVVCWRRVK